MPELDPRLATILINAIRIGISALPDHVDPRFKTAAEACLYRGLEWALRQIEPSDVKVLVENDASATASIDFGPPED